MSAAGSGERARRLALAVGLLVVGLAGFLAAVIATRPRSLGPGDDVPRAVAIPALYATVGVLAILGALQRRRAIVLASGVLGIAGMLLSVATVVFGIPGIALLFFGVRMARMPARSLREPVVALAVAVLVAGASVALLALTDARCWQASGSQTDPSYTVTDCGPQNSPQPVAPPGSWASGYDSGVLTGRGVVIEGILLLAAIGLTLASDQRASGEADLTPGRPPGHQ